MAAPTEDSATEDTNLHPPQGQEILGYLKTQVSQLIALCQALRHENERLTIERKQLISERQSLIEQQQIADEGIERTIDRLKNLIQDY